MDYSYLRPFAVTPRQREILEAVIGEGGMPAAAASLGITGRNVEKAMARIRREAARCGVAPDEGVNHRLPMGQHLKGVSTLLDADGQIKQQWVKSDKTKEETDELIREAIEAFKDEITKATPIPASKNHKNEDLLNCHIITDYHLGMKSWPSETGAAWDLEIAEKMLADCFAYGIKHAPKAEVGVLGQIGDFLHFDGLEAVTPTSGFSLDVDTRFQKVVRVAIRSIRGAVRAMLKKYDRVHLIMADANHDPASSAWLREMFVAFYDNEPRVTVDNTADSYYCIEHGLTSLFFHHGHKRKPANIDDVFVQKFRDVFGRTKYSYGHMGHLHHHHSIETNLMIVTQWRTLAAPDSYAARHGFMSGRGTPVITYSKQYGEVGRLMITPEMLGD